jgi:putative flippase GtrA
MRFAIVGCVVAAVYLLTTTLLRALLRMPFEVALAIGFFLALAVHFTLQRMFVWAPGERFVLGFHQQVGRYLLLALAQYGLTAASVGLLPGRLGLPTELVYLVTVALVASCNFLIFRHRVFHSISTAAPVAAEPEAKAL